MCVGGGGGRGRRGLLFDIDKDALRFAERDKNHLGVFRMESKCFYPRVYVLAKN